MLVISEKFKEHNIKCRIIKMGNDLNITIEGGDIPHIGAVELGIPVDMPHDISKKTTSVSLLTVPGHKEDDVVLKCAKRLVKELGVTVVVTCGIHIKDITFNEINDLLTLINQMMTQIIGQLK